MALSNTISYQEVSIDWLTVTLKNMIIAEVGKQCFTQGSWDGVRDRLITCIEWT